MRCLFLTFLLSFVAWNTIRGDGPFDATITEGLKRNLRSALVLQTELMAFSHRFRRPPADAREFLDFAAPHKTFRAADFPNLTLTRTADGGVCYSFDDPVTHEKRTGKSGPVTITGPHTTAQ